jgi:hypothetical protein
MSKKKATVRRSLSKPIMDMKRRRHFHRQDAKMPRRKTRLASWRLGGSLI